MPLSIDIRTIARVRAVAWEYGEWGIAWETKDGRRGSQRIGSRSDAEAIVLAVIGGGLQPAPAVKAKTMPSAAIWRTEQGPARPRPHASQIIRVAAARPVGRFIGRQSLAHAQKLDAFR